MNTAMGTVFAPSYANLNINYHETKLYDLIESKYNLDITQNFIENWKRFLDDCKMLLNIDLIKLDDLLTTILHSINNDIHFSLELCDSYYPFLDILIKKSGKQIWMKTCSKPTKTLIQITMFLTFLST